LESKRKLINWKPRESYSVDSFWHLYDVLCTARKRYETFEARLIWDWILQVDWRGIIIIKWSV